MSAALVRRLVRLSSAAFRHLSGRRHSLVEAEFYVDAISHVEARFLLRLPLLWEAMALLTAALVGVVRRLLHAAAPLAAQPSQHARHRRYHHDHGQDCENRPERAVGMGGIGLLSYLRIWIFFNIGL